MYLVALESCCGKKHPAPYLWGASGSGLQTWGRHAGVGPLCLCHTYGEGAGHMICFL